MEDKEIPIEAFIDSLGGHEVKQKVYILTWYSRGMSGIVEVYSNEAAAMAERDARSKADLSLCYTIVARILK